MTPATLTEESPAAAPAMERRAEASPPAPARRCFPKGFLFLILGGALAAGTWFYLHGLAYIHTDDAFIEGHITQVSGRVPGHIAKVSVEDNQAVKAGDVLLELDPRDYEVRLEQARAALASVEARVEAARSGLALTSGATSADVEQASSGVDMARSALVAAQAQVETARSAQRQAQAQLEAEQATASEERANARAAEADAAQAQADLKRYEALGEDVISRQQLDQVRTAERNATARLDSARQKAASAEAKAAAARAAVQTASQMFAQAQALVAQAQARIGEASGRLNAANTAPHQVAVSRSQLKALDAELAQARAALRQAELNLEYTKIKAPIAGRVTRKSAEPGNYIQPGQAVMALVAGDVWVVANFKETQLTNMKPGQPVEIEIDAYPSLELKGRVDSIQAGTGARFSLLPPENASGNYVKVVQRVPVKIALEKTPEAATLLAPGMSVEPVVKVK